MTRIITLLVMLVIITPGWVIIASSSDNITVPITYVSYIDDKLGFYKVIDVTLHKDSQYKERVLTINQGDTIMWLNDADTAILTIVSEQNLWDKTKSKLGSAFRRFNYTFMISGTYSTCVDGYKDMVCQTIIVDPVEGYPTPVPILTQSPTPSPTPSPIHTQVKASVEMTKAIPSSTVYPIKDINERKNSSENNGTSEKGTCLSWETIINFINAITGLIVSVSALLITYKIFRDY